MAASESGELNRVAAYFDFRADSWDEMSAGRSPVQGAVVAMAGVGEGDRVLDVGCGTGVMTDFYLDADADEVVGIDVSARMVEIASEKFSDEPRATFVNADVLDFKDDGGFDAVVAYNCYPHIIDKHALVESTARLLRPGGRFVVAHGTSREQINMTHGHVPDAVKTPLMPAAEAAEEWETLFDIDAVVDTPGFYAFAGRLREDYSGQDREAAFYDNARMPSDSEDGRRMLRRMNAGHHAELSEWAFGFIEADPASDAIDVGCGGGANVARLLEACPEGTATGVDYSPTSVEVASDLNSEAMAQGRCDIVLGDVSDLPFDDGSFDVATAFETIYFWPDPAAGIAEIARVLRPCGILMVCNEADGVVNDAGRWSSTIEGMRVYTAEQISEMMRAAELVDVVVHRDTSRGWMAITARKPEE